MGMSELETEENKDTYWEGREALLKPLMTPLL